MILYLRSRKILNLVLSSTLSGVLALGPMVAPFVLPVGITSLVVTQTSCDENEVSQVKKKVADAAAILNTAAKSNRELYRSGAYGVVGSAAAIEKRQKGASVIHQANEYLSLAVERAAKLQAGDISAGKADIVGMLQKAVGLLNSLNVDNEKLQLLIAGAVASINSAVTLTLAIKGN